MKRTNLNWGQAINMLHVGLADRFTFQRRYINEFFLKGNKLYIQFRNEEPREYNGVTFTDRFKIV